MRPCALASSLSSSPSPFSLKAGETGSLTMTFAEAGSLLIGCHEPGHYDAGMRATLTVVE